MGIIHNYLGLVFIRSIKMHDGGKYDEFAAD